MSILNVNTLQPVGSGQTITVTAANITASSATITAGGFTGNLTGNVTGTVNSSGIATFSNGVVVAAGSASAPSISPTGDSNTGIFFPAADTIAFAEGGAEALRIDSSGRFLSGTLSGSYVAGDDGNTGFVVGGTIKGTNSGYNINGSLALDCTNGGAELFLYNSQNVTTADRKYGGINFCAFDSGYFSLGRRGASIHAYADGVTGTGDFPGRLVFSTTADGASNPTERLRITSAGAVQIANGNLVFSTSGTGIDFSATANSSGTMTSELLSDYEEGTWTPTIGGNATYTSRYGQYIKVGGVVTIWGLVWVSTRGTGSQSTITGLPFNNGSQICSGTVHRWLNSAVNVYWMGCAVDAGSGGIFLCGQSGLDATSETSINAMTDNTLVHFSATYNTTL